MPLRGVLSATNLMFEFVGSPSTLTSARFLFCLKGRTLGLRPNWNDACLSTDRGSDKTGNWFIGSTTLDREMDK